MTCHVLTLALLCVCLCELLSAVAQTSGGEGRREGSAFPRLGEKTHTQLTQFQLLKSQV